MKIIAVSDLHGNLIKIKDQCGVFVIAGDWSPLYIQHDCAEVFQWIDTTFIPWMMSINADHVIFIPGNHDIVCESPTFDKDIQIILKLHNSENKIHYLNRSSVMIDHVKYYGLPDSESPNGWAFSRPFNVDYTFDEDTDILITHQPPKVGNVGFVSAFNREFGSTDLRDKLITSNVGLNICGHIHTGEHGEHILNRTNGITRVYNVSILDERYKIAYSPTVIIA